MTTAPMQHLAACSDPNCPACLDVIGRQDATGGACTCIPAGLCGTCEARGYHNALAGYAARIYPARVTPADDAREARVHYIAPDCDDIAPYDTCANCGQPAIERRGELVTMLTGNSECYGNTYRPEH